MTMSSYLYIIIVGDCYRKLSAKKAVVNQIMQVGSDKYGSYNPSVIVVCLCVCVCVLLSNHCK